MRWTVPPAAVAMLAPLASASAAPVALTASEREAVADAAATAVKELNIPGLSIAVARSDSLVFAGGFGLANHERYVKEIVPLMRKIDALLLGGGS